MQVWTVELSTAWRGLTATSSGWSLIPARDAGERKEYPGLCITHILTSLEVMGGTLATTGVTGLTWVVPSESHHAATLGEPVSMDKVGRNATL